MSQFTDEIIRIAKAEIGVHEDGDSNTGKRVNQYKAATNLSSTESWAWCAAFVDWCVMWALQNCAIPETLKFRRPTTAGAWDLITWSLAQDASTATTRNPMRDIQPGDLIIFNFHHCAIATSTCDETGHFQTIEGNTSVGDSGSQRDGGGVHARWRRSSQVKARIRFTV